VKCRRKKNQAGPQVGPSGEARGFAVMTAGQQPAA
jgi:hypothetical protein